MFRINLLQKNRKKNIIAVEKKVIKILAAIKSLDKYIDEWTRIPFEIKIHILSYLDDSDIDLLK